MNFKLTKYACYSTYLSISAIFALPPMLFLTFRESYGISYTLLGTLVLINFCTQLSVDLIFTFFSKHFNIRTTLRVMPVLTSLGFVIYAVIPSLFPNIAYLGLIVGTIVFSVSAGLSEVLLSPTIAAIPSKTPDRDMSFLHSLYAFGVVNVVVVSTVFFLIFGQENWMYLALFWGTLPIISAILYSIAPIPDMYLSHSESSNSSGNKLGIALCVGSIFLGGASECAMTNWISGYIENALGISKAVGDILGLALFAVLLGIGRTLYARYGKNIISVLTFSMSGAAVCYLTAGFSNIPMLSLAACVFTGLFTAMLWPGTLILMEENFPKLGVTAYALMAAGGDLGGSIAPQMLGSIVDAVSASDMAQSLSSKLSLTTEQIGLKVGMISASAFPILGVALLIFINLYFKKLSVKKSQSS